VNSCTAALHLGLEAVGVGPGDEVITSPVTFASTANVIVHRGARPVFVDVEADTLNIDADAIEAAITPRTKAVIPVDFAGQPCELDAIMATARRHGLTVIEDAAHAVGAEFKRAAPRQRGRFDRVLVLRDEEHHERGGRRVNDQSRGVGRTRADHGAARHQPAMRGSAMARAVTRTGTSSRQATNTTCSTCRARSCCRSSRKSTAFQRRRVSLKARLDAGLRDLPELSFPVERGNRVHAHHLYPVIVRVEALNADRDTIMNAIQAENVGIGIHFRAVHLHPYYEQTFGFRRGMFPRAEYYSDRTISLPLYPRMTDAEADDVIAAVRKVIARYRR
jgi:dTDP-4-amino-4,6-dideoxygalactose transaminase